MPSTSGREAFATISQIRLIETKRLEKRLAIVDKDTFERIRKAVKDML